MIKLHTSKIFIKLLPLFQMDAAVMNFACAGQAEHLKRVEMGHSCFLIPLVVGRGHPALQTTAWDVTHAHTGSGCSPQIGSQAGDLARQLAALFVHAPHAVDERREHTSRIWCSEAHLKPAAVSRFQPSTVLVPLIKLLRLNISSAYVSNRVFTITGPQQGMFPSFGVKRIIEQRQSNELMHTANVPSVHRRNNLPSIQLYWE